MPARRRLSARKIVYSQFVNAYDNKIAGIAVLSSHIYIKLFTWKRPLTKTMLSNWLVSSSKWITHEISQLFTFKQWYLKECEDDAANT